MKWLWLIFGLVIVGAAVVLLQETAPRLPAASGPSPEAPGPRDRAPVRAASEMTGARPAAAVPARADGGSATEVHAGAGEALGASMGSSPSAGVTPTDSAGGEGTAPSPTPMRAHPLPTIPNAEVSPGVFERLKSGELVADRRFRILGSGTHADPYRVSWECLASAQESYVPRLGESVIPERIAMLDGKIVRMEGYVTFPLLQKEANELILMLNQWDGCCIGVPPTPYDAIEVKLERAIQNTRRHASFTYGSVTGRFKVEPFLVEHWLVGLYVMEDAVYEPGEL